LPCLIVALVVINQLQVAINVRLTSSTGIGSRDSKQGLRRFWSLCSSVLFWAAIFVVSNLVEYYTGIRPQDPLATLVTERYYGLWLDEAASIVLLLVGQGADNPTREYPRMSEALIN